MADFEQAVKVILKHEGLFVDHPSDPGGATNRGIILSLFKQYAKALGLEPTVDALKTLTEDQAKFIYREHFWDKMKGDEIKSQAVSEIIFDAYVNMGNRALKWLQIELGVGIDGEVGPITLAAINHAAPVVLFEQFKDARIDYYTRLAENKPSMKVFLKGWLNRVNSFNYHNYQNV